jgi:alpha-beta hydrolase superfamily lysophospholipase
VAELRHIEASDGYPLAYRRWSAATTPRVTFVLLNGIMSNSAWFEPVAPLLVDNGHTVVGADRRGSGPNPDARGDAPSAGQLVDDVIAIVEHERTPDVPVILLGWCWGAALAINVAPKLDLAGLVLVTPGIHNKPALEQAVAAQRELIASSAEDAAVIASPVREEWFTDGPQLDAFIRRDEDRVRAMTPRLLDITRRLATAAAVRVRKLDVPLLLVLAENDEATDNEATRAMLPNVETIVLPTRHGVQFDAPRDLAAHLARFAART